MEKDIIKDKDEFLEIKDKIKVIGENNDENKKIMFLHIQKEVIIRLQSILHIIQKYNCDNNKKYKNMIENLINEFTFLQMYTIFNDMFSDLYILSYSYLDKTIKVYYKEIREIIVKFVE